jgi:hypothetical protein
MYAVKVKRELTVSSAPAISLAVRQIHQGGAQPHGVGGMQLYGYISVRIKP